MYTYVRIAPVRLKQLRWKSPRMLCVTAVESGPMLSHIDTTGESFPDSHAHTGLSHNICESVRCPIKEEIRPAVPSYQKYLILGSYERDTP